MPSRRIPRFQLLAGQFFGSRTLALCAGGVLVTIERYEGGMDGWMDREGSRRVHRLAVLGLTEWVGRTNLG